MIESKYTPWFPGWINPARDGVYEVFFAHSLVYSKRSNGKWIVGGGRSVRLASLQTAVAMTPVRWRGLAKEPK